MIKNLNQYPIVRNINYNKNDLIDFENKIVLHWESGKIRGPVHLSNGNETELIEIFQRIKKSDWVFSTWRNHYHALLKGINQDWLEDQILKGKSITICNIDEKFYSSAIVGGGLSIALGVAAFIKRNGHKDNVWCFLGDMCFESGIFYEVYKYSKNFDLPINFIIEDNGVSTNTPTKHAWNKTASIPEDVIYYTYQSKYPHYGTGKWVVF